MADVTSEDIQDFKMMNPEVLIFEVSARFGTQCTEAFTALCLKMLESKKSIVTGLKLKNNRQSRAVDDIGASTADTYQTPNAKKKSNSCCKSS